MTPAKKGGGKGGGKRKPKADDTREYELGDDFLSDIDDEEVDPEDLEDEEYDDLEDEGYDDLEAEDEEDLDDEEFDEDEDYDDEELDEEDLGEDDGVSEEDELEEGVPAGRQEWEGLEAAEAEGDGAEEKTLVGSAGARVHDARSAITSGFEKVKGTQGFQAIRKWRPGFPVWLRFLTASLVIVLSIAGATSASLILYLSDIANALRHGSVLNGVEPFLKTPGSGPQTILILGSDKRNN